MRFAIIIATVFAAAAVAAPTSNVVVSKRSPMQSVADSASAAMKAQEDDGCSVVDCILALAPASATCALAAAEVGVNLIMDAACFAGVLNSLANKPEACGNCSADDA